MPHYRVTRPEKYGRNTSGYTDKGSRQGYYTDAQTPEEAKDIIRKRFRDEEKINIDGETLDVQVWE